MCHNYVSGKLLRRNQYRVISGSMSAARSRRLCSLVSLNEPAKRKVYQRANGRRIKPALEAASECSIENHRWTFFIFGTSYHQLIRCRLHKWRLAAMDSPFDFEHCHTTVCPSKDYLSTSISLQHGRLSLVISKRYVLPLNATVKLNRFSNRSMQLHISFCFIGSLTFPPSLWPL